MEIDDFTKRLRIDPDYAMLVEADPDDPEDRPISAGDARRALAERAKRMRGAQVAPTKQQVTVRLDRAVIERLKAGGPGWQTRMNDELRRALRLG